MAEAMREELAERTEAGPASRTVAMVGAGQLARMTQRAAIDLGIELRVLASSESESAVRAGVVTVIGSPSELDDLRRLAEGARVITFDHEGVPTELIAELEREGLTVVPAPEAKRLAQDKWHARERLGSEGFPFPPHKLVHTPAEVREFGDAFGWPVVAKAPVGGYDGRGVWEWEGPGDLQSGERLPEPVLVEPKLDLDLEISVLVARSTIGETVTFPVAETVQRDAMCREIVVPARISPDLAERACDLAVSVVEKVGACGIVAVEMFVDDDELLLNELALRPHNSGHFTIEGCETSQFEQHLRAILGWPLGSTALTAPSVVTVNVVGPDDGSDPRERVAQAVAVEGAHVHIYDKEPRPGRKLGHVTVRANDPVIARERALEAVEILEGRAAGEEGVQ